MKVIKMYAHPGEDVAPLPTVAYISTEEAADVLGLQPEQVTREMLEYVAVYADNSVLLYNFWCATIREGYEHYKENT